MSNVFRFLRASSNVSFARARCFNNDRRDSTYHNTRDEKQNKVGTETQENHFTRDDLSRQSHSMSAGESALSGFRRALEKFDEERSLSTDSDEDDGSDFRNEQFSTMLRRSKLMQIGEPSSRVVLGTIIETVGDDLYIDFGGKFHCVCPRPNLNPESYHRGIRVKISLNDFEMTSSFLGSEKHLTLQEADGTLIGIHRSSKKQP